MRSKVVRLLALMLLLCGTGIGLAQQGVPKKVRVEEEEEKAAPRAQPKSPPEKSRLEEMLTEALKNNGDIRVAVAKLAEAEAELNRTRVQVTQQVVTLYHAIDTQKKVVQHSERNAMRLHQTGVAVPVRERDEASQTLALAKAKLAELEAQMPGLLGKMSRNAESGALSLPTRMAFSNDGKSLFLEIDTDKPIIPHRAMGPVAEKIRKAFDRPISVSFENRRVTEIVDVLSKDTGLVIKLTEASGVRVPEKLTVRFENLPFGAVLQLLEDSLPYYTIVVRDYGLLITHCQSVPPGALSVQEFLRQKPADEPGHQASSGRNPPPKHVKGHIKAIKPKGFIIIDVGSDAGLAKGHTLELFRFAENPPQDTTKHLGTIRILETKEKEALCRQVGRLTHEPKVGDWVTSGWLVGN
jgi:hypothetical protein